MSSVPLVVVFVPVVPRSALNVREHHMARARRVRAERETTLLCLLRARASKGLPVAVEFVRRGARRLDSDNLPGSCKAFRDEVAAYLGVDDGPQEKRVTWTYSEEPTRNVREQGLEIRFRRRNP